eukprot:1569260-Prymnesium_polylepis.3
MSDMCAPWAPALRSSFVTSHTDYTCTSLDSTADAEAEREADGTGEGKGQCDDERECKTDGICGYLPPFLAVPRLLSLAAVAPASTEPFHPVGIALAPHGLLAAEVSAVRTDARALLLERDRFAAAQVRKRGQQRGYRAARHLAKRLSSSL